MNGLLEAKAFETKPDDEALEVVVVVIAADGDHKEFVRRCGELLAKQATDEDCPPGNWLG